MSKHKEPKSLADCLNNTFVMYVTKKLACQYYNTNDNFKLNIGIYLNEPKNKRIYH